MAADPRPVAIAAALIWVKHRRVATSLFWQLNSQHRRGVAQPAAIAIVAVANFMFEPGCHPAGGAGP
jgi:hypothetical protein